MSTKKPKKKRIKKPKKKRIKKTPSSKRPRPPAEQRAKLAQQALEYTGRILDGQQAFLDGQADYQRGLGRVGENIMNLVVSPNVLEPQWSRPTSKSGAAIFLGVSVSTIDARLKKNPSLVMKLSRQLWQFDKNDPLFRRLP